MAAVKSRVAPCVTSAGVTSAGVMSAVAHGVATVVVAAVVSAVPHVAPVALSVDSW